MRYGYIIPNFGPGGDARGLADLARDAEEAGWDGFFVWDHIEISPRSEPNVDPWVALAAMAVRTERIKLGPMVTPIPRRRIAKLARETVTLDHLSGGRVIFGAGAGYPGPEYTAFGDEADPKTRGAMVEEGLALLDKFWSGEPVEHHGDFYTATTEGFAPPLQNPRIPIWLASTWPFKKPLRRAARYDGVVPMAKNAMQGELLSPQDVRDLIAYVSEHRETDAPFSVSQFGMTRDRTDATMPRLYEEAGATWWFEMCPPFFSARDAAERIRKGPPRGD